MPSILIADDHAMIRTGLRHYLEQDRSIDKIGETGTGAQTLQELREGNWDLVILDINMPDRSGIDILRHIRSGHPETRVLVMSGFAEKQYAINVLRAGASGYLAKDQAPEEFMRAVHTVLAGRRFVVPRWLSRGRDTHHQCGRECQEQDRSAAHRFPPLHGGEGHRGRGASTITHPATEPKERAV